MTALSAQYTKLYKLTADAKSVKSAGAAPKGAAAVKKRAPEVKPRPALAESQAKMVKEPTDTPKKHTVDAALTRAEQMRKLHKRYAQLKELNAKKFSQKRQDEMT